MRSCDVIVDNFAEMLSSSMSHHNSVMLWAAVQLPWQYLHQMTSTPRQPTCSRSPDVYLLGVRSPQYLPITCLCLHQYEEPESLTSSSSNELPPRDIAMPPHKRGTATSAPIAHQRPHQRHLAGYVSRAKSARLRAAYETATHPRHGRSSFALASVQIGTAFSHCNAAPARRNVSLFQVSFLPWRYKRDLQSSNLGHGETLPVSSLRITSLSAIL